METKEEAEKQVLAASKAQQDANNQHMKDFTAHVQRQSEAYKHGQKFTELKPVGDIQDPHPLYDLAASIRRSQIWPPVDEPLKSQWEAFQASQKKK